MCRLLEIFGALGALRACSDLYRDSFSFISIIFLEIIKESKLAIVTLYKYNNMHEGQFYFESCWSLT
jgi:hypothetical protein